MKSAVAVNFIAIFVLFSCLHLNIAKNIGSIENVVNFSNQIVSEIITFYTN